MERLKKSIQQLITLYNEPEWLEQLRLNALKNVTLDNMSIASLMTFDERDERGFGVLSHIDTDKSTICQYGVLTTFEQVEYALMQAGVVVCDLQEAIALHHIQTLWEKLSPLHQALTNSGLYIYVPKGIQFTLDYYVVQDNSVEEAMIKSIFIVKDEDAQVHINLHELAFGEYQNFKSVEWIEVSRKETLNDARTV